LGAVRATFRPVLRAVLATLRPVLRAVRAVLRAVRFVVAIVFLRFCFDVVAICPFSSALSSNHASLLADLPSHMASQLLFYWRSRLKCCASHAVQRVEPCSFLWSVRWSAPRKQRQEMSSGPSSVSCIQTRSTRADEECCARICLQRHSHQRGLPWDH